MPLKTVWLIVQICVFQIVKCEPQCSKYDFQEKLLEKLVRMEFRMGQMETEIGNIREQLTSITKTTTMDTTPLPVITTPAIPTIVFMSRDPANKTPVDNKVIVFTISLMNHGEGYDKTTGVFTAPVDGVYLFTTQFCIYNGGRYMYYHIMHNHTPITRSLIYDNSSDFCSSSNVIIVMKASDRVWVECARTSDKKNAILWERNDEQWNTFSGVLLHN